MLSWGMLMSQVELRLLQMTPDRVSADTDQTLFEALADQGLVLRKSCDNGVCGICRCRLMSGAVDYRGRHPYGLNGGQQADGWILPCIAYPKANLKLNHLRLDER